MSSQTQEAETRFAAMAATGAALGAATAWAFHSFGGPAIPNVTYVTDVEGNYEYFQRFVEQSEGLTLKSVEPDGVIDIEVREGWHFVFGGDVCDKGGAVGGTIRVTKSLLAAKKKYPSRVTLLLGNRDLNKMRLTSELAPDQMAALETVPGPYWVPEDKRVSPEGFLRARLAKEQGKAPEAVSAEDVRAANTLPNRLRWMLKDTMGADGEFERRQRELTAIRQGTAGGGGGGGGGAASEEEAARSFVESVEPGGFMREYIEVGELAKVIGNTLYVHGGVVGAFRDGATVALGVVPSTPPVKVSGVGPWIAALHRWLDSQRAEWAAHPRWEADAGGGYAQAYRDGRRGGHSLMDNVVPNSLPSVILARHLDRKGMPAPLPPEVETALAASGVRRLVIGHTPHGNCPTVIKSAAGAAGSAASVDTFMADTSFSNMKDPSGDNRGSAVSELSLLCDGSTRVRGVLEDGTTRIAYSVPPLPGAAPPPPAPSASPHLIGRVVPGASGAKDFFVKSLTAAGEYLLCNVEGFAVTYERLPRAEVLRRLSLTDAAATAGAAPPDELPTPEAPPARAGPLRLPVLVACAACGAALAVALALRSSR